MPPLSRKKKIQTLPPQSRRDTQHRKCQIHQQPRHNRHLPPFRKHPLLPHQEDRNRPEKPNRSAHKHILVATRRTPICQLCALARGLVDPPVLQQPCVFLFIAIVPVESVELRPQRGDVRLGEARGEETVEAERLGKGCSGRGSDGGGLFFSPHSVEPVPGEISRDSRNLHTALSFASSTSSSSESSSPTLQWI